jgi:hypothetical protein
MSEEQDMSEEQVKYEVAQRRAGTGFSLALNPDTAAEAMKCAEWLAKCDLVPKGYQGKPHDIVVAAAMGARLGLDPFSALAGIAVVNGRPTLWGDAMLAVCQQRSDWGGMSVEWKGEGETLACSVTIVRVTAHGQQSYTGRFSVADAKTAGLWKKQGPWTQYPSRMLELRARAYALRGSFADALAGFHAREEMEDLPPADATVRPADPVPAVVFDPPAADAAEQATPPADKRTIVREAKTASPAVEAARAEWARLKALGLNGDATAIITAICNLYDAEKPADVKPENAASFIAAIGAIHSIDNKGDLWEAVRELEQAAKAEKGGAA